MPGRREKGPRQGVHKRGSASRSIYFPFCVVFFRCLLSCETFGPLLCLHEITLALVCVVEAVPTDEKDKGNTANINSGNNSHTQYYTSFLSSY